MNILTFVCVCVCVCVCVVGFPCLDAMFVNAPFTFSLLSCGSQCYHFFLGFLVSVFAQETALLIMHFQSQLP